MTFDGRDHFRVRIFDSEGDFVEESTTVDFAAPRGMGRLLARDEVKAVEVHHKDGTSIEYSQL